MSHQERNNGKSFPANVMNTFTTPLSDSPCRDSHHRFTCNFTIQPPTVRTEALPLHRQPACLIDDDSALQRLFCYETIPPYLDPFQIDALLVAAKSSNLPAAATTTTRAPEPTKRKQHQTNVRKQKRPRPDNKRKKQMNKKEKPLLPETERTHTSTDLFTYDWSSLKLGTELGSAAWNQILRQRLDENPALGEVPQVSPLECLLLVQSIQHPIVIPPDDSPLHHVLKDPRNWQPDAAGNVTTTTTPDLGSLYRAMVFQELHGDALNRYHYQTMTANEIRDKLGRVEAQAAAMDRDEQRILEQSRKLGLITKETASQVNKMSGYWRATTHDGSHDNDYWREDFAAFLQSGDEKAAFLSFQDKY